MDKRVKELLNEWAYKYEYHSAHYPKTKTFEEFKELNSNFDIYEAMEDLAQFIRDETLKDADKINLEFLYLLGIIQKLKKTPAEVKKMSLEHIITDLEDIAEKRGYRKAYKKCQSELKTLGYPKNIEQVKEQISKAIFEEMDGIKLPKLVKQYPKFKGHPEYEKLKKKFGVE